MKEPAIKNAVDFAEDRFCFQDLLQTEYFRKYKRAYYYHRDQGLQIEPRNYFNLLKFLNEIFDYNEHHARSFANRIRANPNDWRNCEAVFAELIVYRYYIRATCDGLLKAIHMQEAEADIILERPDGSKVFLEVFCIMPAFKNPEPGEFVIGDLKTHTQQDFASIRQKLLRKITKQKQFSVPRENYAVIELNDSLIAGDFSILSSLSSGYTVSFNRQTMEVISEGYDWRESVFDDPSTSFLKGIIYFDLGDYPSRKYIFNPNFGKEAAPNKPNAGDGK